MKQIIFGLLLMVPMAVMARARKAPEVKPAETTDTPPVKTDTLLSNNDELAPTKPNNPITPHEPAVPAVQMKFGTVESVDTKSKRIRMQGMTGRDADVSVTEKTQYMQNNAPVTLSDLKKGDTIRYYFDKDGSVEKVERYEKLDISE